MHHVMVRGIERQRLFRTTGDRCDLIRRVATLAPVTGTRIYAWSLMPTHIHLVLRSGGEGLSSFMRRLLTGYAVSFNRRHERVGHLLQNRFRSVLVDEERYFLELLRYVHLNPIRARLVGDVPRLDAYPWTGHARLMGRIDDGWQDVEFVLRQFGAKTAVARRAYRAFLAEGLAAPQPELPDAGLVQAADGWQLSSNVRRGREQWAAAERLLGAEEFADAVRAECECRPPLLPVVTTEDPRVVVRRLVEFIAPRCKVAPEELLAGRRRRSVVSARAGVSYLAVRYAGLPLRAVAAAFGVSPPTILRAVRTGARHLSHLGLQPEDLLPPPSAGQQI